MDCPSEENLIRMALDGVSGIKNLKFDLKNRELAVVHNEGANSQLILAKLAPLNFGTKFEKSEDFKSDSENDDLMFKSDQTKDESKVLKILLAINGSMFVVELLMGLTAQSTGLISDSLDMFADAAVYATSLYVVGKSKNMQSKAAMLSGILQLVLALSALSEVIRRFVFGSEPNSPLMIAVSSLALIANVSCLLLLAKHRDGAVHMKASWIFSTNDVIANIGVIIAGILVHFFKSQLPDLIIGLIIAVIVLRGAFTIIKLARSTKLKPES